MFTLKSLDLEPISFRSLKVDRRITILHTENILNIGIHM